MSLKALHLLLPYPSISSGEEEASKISHELGCAEEDFHPHAYAVLGLPGHETTITTRSQLECNRLLLHLDGDLGHKKKILPWH